MLSAALKQQLSSSMNPRLLTHYLSDGDGLSQSGGAAGSRHVEGSNTELQPVPGGETPDDQGRPVSQTLHGR
mgnify:CR=1 FL=1